MKKETGLKNGKALFTSGGILPVSLVATVLIMLAVRAMNQLACAVWDN